MVLSNPARAARVNNWLATKLPFVHRHVTQFAIYRGLVSTACIDDNNIPVDTEDYSIQIAAQQFQALSNNQPDRIRFTPIALGDGANSSLDVEDYSIQDMAQQPLTSSNNQPDFSHLTPHARQIYQDLAAAIARSQE